MKYLVDLNSKKIVLKVQDSEIIAEEWLKDLWGRVSAEGISSLNTDKNSTSLEHISPKNENFGYELFRWFLRNYGFVLTDDPNKLINDHKNQVVVNGQIEKLVLPDTTEIYQFIDNELEKAGFKIPGKIQRSAKQVGKEIEYELYSSLSSEVRDYLESLKGDELPEKVLAGDEHQEIVTLNEHDESVLQKLQPPRPGLVPQSGDWNAPFRWIRPSESIESTAEKYPEQSFVVQTKKIGLQQVKADLDKLKIEAKRILKEQKIKIKRSEISSLDEELRVIEWSFLARDYVIWSEILDTYSNHVPENGRLYSMNVGTANSTEAVGRYAIYNDGHIEIFYLGTNPKNLYWNPDQSQKKRGAGTALILEFVKLANKIGAPRVSLYSEDTALPFYKKVGFHLKKTGIGQNQNRMTLYAKDYGKILQ